MSGFSVSSARPRTLQRTCACSHILRAGELMAFGCGVQVEMAEQVPAGPKETADRETINLQARERGETQIPGLDMSALMLGIVRFDA